MDNAARVGARRAVRLAPLIFCLALLGLLDRCCLKLQAAPPTIQPVAHPYDPDWPDVYLILASKCTACHRPGCERADLSSYEQLIHAQAEGLPVVVPGDPEQSLLWQYLAWNVLARADAQQPDAPMMPPDRHEWLSAGQLEIVYRWISNGARQYRVPEQCHGRPLLEIDFPSAKQCGACHPKQYEEWARSMHAYGQHSPVFEAFNLTLIERTSGTMGTFCTRCHTPLGTILGENGSRRNTNRSRLSMEGVTCVTCHRRKDGHYKASSRISVEPGGILDACVYGPFDDARSAEVGAHPSQGLPYIKTSQFCGECHDVTIPAGVRLEEAFSEWHNSPAAKSGITCQHCHMGPIQGIPIPDSQRPIGRAAVVPGVDPERLPLRHLTDHTFAGPDYSLLPDTEFPYKLDWMYEVDYRDSSQLTPYQQKTLEELRRKNRQSLAIADAKRYEVLRNAARLKVSHPASAPSATLLKVRVDVVSTLAGHSLPTGFTAERQVWVALQLRDPQGQLVFASGDLDPNGDLRDEHSHAVLSGRVAADRYLLNFQNKFIALGQKGTDRSVVISVNRNLQPVNIIRPAPDLAASFGRPAGFRIAKGSLPPLGVMGQDYPVRLPATPGPYLLEVRLNFRHLPPTLLDHVGTPHLKHLLEVVELDHYQAVIDVAP